MANRYTVTTHESWGTRLKDSFKSVLVGVLLAIVAVPVMWCNEGRAVRTARSLEEGAGAVVSITTEHVDPGYEGKLVHMSGRADTTDTVTDPVFGVGATALKLVRKVEMYQWREDEKTETKQKFGGGQEKTTTYEYRKVWSTDVINSSQFRSTSYQNPGKLPWPSLSQSARLVTLGAFVLSPAQIQQLDASDRLAVDARVAAGLPPGTGVRPADGVYYRGTNPADPQVGDVRVSFSVLRPLTVSLVGRQVGNSFEPYQAKAGNELLLVNVGMVSADAMFKAAEAENRLITWILRGVGALLLFLGFVLLFRPIATLGAVVPLVGTLLGAGLAAFSFLAALVVSLLTMAAAWLFYRPLLSLTLLAAAAVALLLLKRRAGRTAAR